LISIRKAANELDRLETLRRVTAECYGLAIRSTAQYAVEVGPAMAEGFRRHLESLQDQLRNAVSPEEIQALQSSFRGKLRDHRDRSMEQLARLREELATAASAMQSFADSVTTAGTDHEDQLKAELAELVSSAQADDLDTLRNRVHSAARVITESVDQMKRSNRLVVAQLCDEIRLLHQEIEAGRKILTLDPAFNVWNRQTMEARVDELVRQNERFCFLEIHLRNLRRLESEHERGLIEAGLKALLQRFSAMVNQDGRIGRWSEENFGAILEMEPATAIAFSEKVSRTLSGTYSVQESGGSRTIAIQVSAGVIDCPVGTDAEMFRSKITQLSSALCGA